MNSEYRFLELLIILVSDVRFRSSRVSDLDAGGRILDLGARKDDNYGNYVKLRQVLQQSQFYVINYLTFEHKLQNCFIDFRDFWEFQAAKLIGFQDSWELEIKYPTGISKPLSKHA